MTAKNKNDIGGEAVRQAVADVLGEGDSLAAEPNETSASAEVEAAETPDQPEEPVAEVEAETNED